MAKVTLDYFYGDQAEQFSFYRIPKVLFTDERFRNISAEAKVLYGILLDRMSLSRKNGWLDDDDRVYIIFTLDEVMSSIGCAVQKAAKLLSELDEKSGLIERKRQGLGNLSSKLCIRTTLIPSSATVTALFSSVARSRRRSRS